MDGLARLAALAAVGSLACQEPGRSGAAQGATGSAPAVATPGGARPSFSRDVLPVLVRTCAATAACHGERPTNSVDLDLRPAAAWAHLVGHPAEGRAGALRVKPGDATHSFLVDKLLGRLGRGEGPAMPLDPATDLPASPNPLPPEFVTRTLIPWIAAGALRD